MTLFHSGPIQQIETSAPNLYAFRINGRIDDDASEDLAKFMNDVFDRHPEKVDMLLDLTGFTGSDWDSLFDGDVIRSRFRALSEVRRYAVIGAPEKAQKMIGVFNTFISVEAKAFGASEASDAWTYVGEAHQAN